MKGVEFVVGGPNSGRKSLYEQEAMLERRARMLTDGMTNSEIAKREGVQTEAIRVWRLGNQHELENWRPTAKKERTRTERSLYNDDQDTQEDQHPAKTHNIKVGDFFVVHRSKQHWSRDKNTVRGRVEQVTEHFFTIRHIPAGFCECILFVDLATGVAAIKERGIF